MAIRASRPVVERAISAFLTFFTGIFLFAWGSSLGALPAHAQTTLSGNVFGNLDASGNPYVTSGFTIPAGQTLTVGEGVIIKLRSAGSIAVNGSLVVNGSAAQPAYLTSIKDDAVGGDSNLDGAGSTPFAYDWQEISVPTGGSVEMTNAVIRYGGFGFNGVPFNCIRVSGGTVTVGSSTITYCGNRAVSMTGGAVSLVDVDFSHAAIGVEQSGGTLNVLDSIFEDASTAGISSTSGNLDIVNSRFEGPGKAAVIDGSVSFTHSGNAATAGSIRGFQIGGLLNSSAVWNADLPYYVAGLTIPAGKTLTVLAGAVVKLGPSASMLVNGGLSTYGTPGDPVRFTSIKDDAVYGDTNGDGSATSPAARDWQEIQVASGGSLDMAGAEVRYGGFGFNGVPFNCLRVLGGTVSVSNSSFAFCGNRIAVISGGSAAFDSVDFSNSTAGIVHGGSSSLSVDSSTFHHISGASISSTAGVLNIFDTSFAGPGQAATVSAAVAFMHSGNTATAGSIRGFQMSGTLGASQTWNPDLPYVVTSMTIPAGRTLTVAPGAVVKMASSGSITVDGSLDLAGTALLPVNVTSVKDDTVGGDTNGDGAASTPGGRDWQQLLFRTGSSGTFTQAKVRYGGSGFNGEPFNCVRLSGGGLTVTASRFLDCGNRVFVVQSGSLSVSNSEFALTDAVVERSGGTVNITGSSLHDVPQIAVNNLAAGQILAENNWWGNASGPKHATLNAAGTGVRAAGDIDFIPWLTSDPLLVPTMAGLSQRLLSTQSSVTEGGAVHEDGLSFSVVATSPAGSNVSVQWEVRPLEVAFSGVPTATTGPLASGSTHGLSMGAALFSAGEWHWRVRAVDAQGHTSAWSEFGTAGNVDFVVPVSDANAPVVAFSELVANQLLVARTVTVAVEASDGAEGSGVATVVLNGHDCMPATGDGWSCPEIPLEDGPNLLSVAAADEVGNSSVTSLEVRRRNPVVLVPGIMGSHLYENGEKVWFDFIQLRDSSSDDFLKRLQMDASGSTSELDENGQQKYHVSVGDVVRYTDTGSPLDVGDIDTFQGLVAALEGKGYLEGESLFTAAYDWRLDLQQTRDGLGERIADIVAATHTDKVDFVAHSMGGLQAQDYLDVYGGASVGKVVYVGTPHLGSPKAAKMLTVGDYIDPVGVVNPQRLREIGLNSPSLYQLLPRPGYFSAAAPYLESFNASLSGAGNPLSLADSEQYLLAHGANPDLLARADAYAARNLAAKQFAGVDAYNFASCDKGGAPMVYLLDADGAIRDVVYGTGDGTVPLASAEGVNVPAVRKFRVARGSHSGLPSADGVRQAVVGLLADDDLSLASAMGTSSVACGLRGQQQIWRSPVDVHVYDAEGRHTGPGVDGSLEFGIPGVRYDIIGHEKFLFLPTGDGEQYDVRAVGTDSGTFDLTLKENVDGVVTHSTVFNDVPVVIGTPVSFGVSDASDDATILVGEGEGAVHVAATVVNDGAITSDFVPPVTDVSAAGQRGLSDWYVGPVTVTMTAGDAGSGVHATYYSLDGGSSWTEYTGPFVMAADGEHDVRYYSVDNFGTDEAVRGLSIRIDTAIPETTISAAPADPTREAVARLEFLSSEENAGFECALDGAGFAPCVSPIELSGLADGAHSFAVRAVDAAGNADTTPAIAGWLQDTVAPVASVSSPVNGSYVNYDSVAVTVAASDSGSGVGSVTIGEIACDSVTATSWQCLGVPLLPGANELRAVVIDRASNQAEAVVTVNVDTDAPETELDFFPQPVTSTAAASFAFHASEGGSFVCSLDGVAFTQCQSPANYLDLADGTHSFAVRAVDAAGNADLTPAESAWIVDTTSPEITADPAPVGLEQGQPFAYSYAASDSGPGVAVVSAALDGVPFISGEALSPGPGSHIIEVSASDVAGNTASMTTTFNVVGVLVLAPDADTAVRQGGPNFVHGADVILPVTNEGRGRALLRFPIQGALPPAASVLSATLSFDVSSNGGGWGEGRQVELHRLLRAWSEAGATWNCADDFLPMSPKADCAPADRWDMAGGAPFAQVPTASVVVTNSTLGTVALDVMANVAAGSTMHGWVLMKEDENRQGTIGIGARESGAGARLEVRYLVE